MKRFPILLTLLAALLVSACGGGPIQPTSSGGSVSSPAAPPAPAAPEGGIAGEAPAVDTGNLPDLPDVAPNAQPSQRLVIRNGMLVLQVEQVREAESTIRATADRLGGFVVSSETSGDDDYLTARIVFRVPSERFDEALGGVSGIAHKVLSRSVSGEDVTEEFVDLEARLRTLEATQQRLLDLLARSASVEEALSVNTALTDVQGQVEQVKGRMQYLKQNAAMSTVSVELQPVPVTPLVDEDGWQPIEVARGALRELLGFGQGIVNLAIVLLIWSPVWLALLLVGRWGLRRITRGRKQPAPPAPPAPPSPA
jgi:hypothetical protein